jgi:hypothetical protein
MSCQSCGHSAATCGCCEGIHAATPVSEYNRPGLDALSYRAGTHGSFLATMQARLPGMTVPVANPDGSIAQLLRPLQALTTRDSGDPAIALLDAWAAVADVLTFYQERIANEGFLRTATERRSVLELARLVGYRLRPGVAASVYLAYTLEEKQAEPVEIPAGSRVQSVPGPDELPQTFETSEALVARGAWNNLQVRRSRPQQVTLEFKRKPDRYTASHALLVGRLYASGANLGLATGDLLLLTFSGDGAVSVLRTVAAAEGQFAEDRTEIRLQPLPAPVAAITPLLDGLVRDMTPIVGEESGGATQRAFAKAQEILAAQYLGLYSDPAKWTAEIINADGEIDPGPLELIVKFELRVRQVLQDEGPPPAPHITSPGEFVEALLTEPAAQAANSLRLRRTRQALFAPGADAHAQLLLKFAPRLKDSFYAAWAGADVNAAAPALLGVQVLRMKAPLFGAGVAKQPSYDANHQLLPQGQWLEWPLESDELPDGAFLDQAYDNILAGGYVVLQINNWGGVVRTVRRVKSADAVQRTGYGISGKSTRLVFDRRWWNGNDDSMTRLRSTLVYAGAETLLLAEEPLDAVVQGQEIELAGLHQELVSGRWLVFSGERADIPGVSGVRASELQMVSGIRHGYNDKLPGDKTHTTLVLATATTYAYKRDSLVIHANVVKATHGETRGETLGSGSGAALQVFALKQPPLTFVAAPTPSGVDSTLAVHIDEVEWTETDTLAGAGPRQRSFVTSIGDDNRVTLTFGNGHEGARVPSGVENVRASYRQGIGMAGRSACRR